jgi:predicted dienelactone hydrolase
MKCCFQDNNRPKSRLQVRTMPIRFPAILLILVLGGATAQAAEHSIQIAGLAVTVWAPATLATGGAAHPIVVFSHGFHGCATQSRFLMDALASAGFVVVAPNHRDAVCSGASWTDKPELSFRQPGRWDDTTFHDRAEDIRRLIDALKSDESFRTRVDWSRLGLAGHSLGGYTVLGLGGAWKSWTLPNVKAILALSPYTAPFVEQQTLGQISVPVMYQGGTRDAGVTPMLHKSMGAYDQTTASKYYVEFNNAGHFAWTNLVSTSHVSIVIYSVAFLNHYVKGERSNAVLTRKLPDVARLQFNPK